MNKETVIKQLGLTVSGKSALVNEDWITIRCEQDYRLDIDILNRCHISAADIKALNYIVEHPEEFFEREKCGGN
jgi:hypothetical protein